MLEVPARLVQALTDRYRIERELGAGGMATVWLAEDLKHHRKVAIKVLRPELASAVGPERFLGEIQIIASLQHPHILGLIDSGDADGLFYFVMPFVEGESLRVRLTRETQLSIDEAVRIASEVGSALDYAHRHNVVHRDIKPENILLQDGNALVVDFGIALALQESAGDRLTATGTSIGTPRYMSPEQATGAKTVGAPSDIYSLGAVLYEMLAGEPPFTGPTAPSIVAKLLAERPTRLRVVRGAVPAAVDDAIARALEKAPADRFSSSQDFVRALHRPQAVARVGRTQVRRWAIALMAAALLLTLGIRWSRTGSRDDELPRPEATQLTFTGNADVPALSADGSRVAYVARECAATGVCTSTIMISDTSGSASLPVISGRGLIDDLEWTSDDRMLLFNELTGGTSHSFAVSTLGGQPRLLGIGPACLLGGVDTALVLDPFVPGSDSVSWLRLVTLADGVTRDSIPIPVRGWNEVCLGSPDGRRIATVSQGDSLWTSHILDREGHHLDSLSHGSWAYFTIRWTPSGDALLVTNSRGEQNPRSFDLLRYPVTEAGRIRRNPDTLLRQIPMSMGHIRVGQTGGLVYAARTPDVTLYAFTRTKSRAFQFTARPLLAATGSLYARVNPSGTKVLFSQRLGAGGTTALSIMPFDSGPALQVGAPVQDFEGYNWAAGGEGVLMVRRRGDRFVVTETDPSTRVVKEMGTVPAPAGARVSVIPISGGGTLVMVWSSGNCDLRSMGVPGAPDSTFDVPVNWCNTLVPAPGRAEAILWIWESGTVQLMSISLISGSIAPLSLRLPGLLIPVEWLPDGEILLTLDEANEVGLYRITAPGAAPERIGSLPWAEQLYSFSVDAQHAVASVSEPRRDVFVVNSFKGLLGKKH